MAEDYPRTKGEQTGISITDEDVAEAEEHGANCLIGKVWTKEKITKEAFKTVMAKIWRAEQSITFREVQDNLWIFEFTDEDTKPRVLEGRPWSFDRHILVINDFDGTTTPAQMDFSHSPCWIQVHDMPLLCMTKAVGTKIGESMGEVEDVDVGKDGVGWGRFLRIRVKIDLTQPLERGRALLMGGKSIWVNFKYE
jgi:hypothetical protein